MSGPSASPGSVDADLKALLRQVKLGRIRDTLPERLALARAEKLPHADFLTLVLADEVDQRDRNSAKLHARTAKLDLSMRRETFTATGQPGSTGSSGTSCVRCGSSTTPAER